MQKVSPAKPLRTCVGCRRVTCPSELIRVVRRAGGTLAIGRGEPGRGAWLCAGSADCLEGAIRRRAFDRALRAKTTTDEHDGLRATLLGQPASSR